VAGGEDVEGCLALISLCSFAFGGWSGEGIGRRKVVTPIKYAHELLVFLQ
jgi:hypothetical protein